MYENIKSQKEVQNNHTLLSILIKFFIRIALNNDFVSCYQKHIWNYVRYIKKMGQVSIIDWLVTLTSTLYWVFLKQHHRGFFNKLYWRTNKQSIKYVSLWWHIFPPSTTMNFLWIQIPLTHSLPMTQLLGHSTQLTVIFRQQTCWE